MIIRVCRKKRNGIKKNVFDAIILQHIYNHILFLTELYRYMIRLH